MSGLDPALKARADGLRAQGRQFVYGFLLPDGPVDEALEQKLSGLGVELLGRHDDHYKARLPVGSLHAIAATPDVEWIGLSSPKQKVSSELAELRSPHGKAAAIDGTTPIPIVVNLFDDDEAGNFRRQLEAAGAVVGEYDAELQFYRAVATGPVIDQITALDFVLFVELVGMTTAAHSESMALIDADVIRPGMPFGHTRFGGVTIPIGIMDSGVAASFGGHVDLTSKYVCGRNFTTDPGTAFDDAARHGSHVLGTIAGSGTADARYRGIATEAGLIPTSGIRAAKIWDANLQGFNTWMEAAMDWMVVPGGDPNGECPNAPPPFVINVSGGGAATAGPLNGTDSRSRKLDHKVWYNGQLYVVAAGNEGPGAGTIRTPGVAKNALTVGSVLDNTYLFVGDVANNSSRGPTADGRMKPNVVAPGHRITSVAAGTTNLYREESGTSMAAPHVTGLAATLMQHYPVLQFKPALARAHMMATALGHDNYAVKHDWYGTGRVSGYVAHWDITNNDGWTTQKFYGTVNAFGAAYETIFVPPLTKRLVVAMTWDDPPASAGASRAVIYDIDLWVDYNADCTNPAGACGEYSSRSTVDNVEYVSIDNPPSGYYRLKVVPADASTEVLKWGMSAVIIRGDTQPDMLAFMSSTADPVVGATFGVTMNLVTSSWVASGAQVEHTTLPPGVTPLYVETMRADGVVMRFPDALSSLTLGNLTPMVGRGATWYFRADSPGPKTFNIRAWSENGGETIGTTTVTVQSGSAPFADLVQTALTMNPPAPVRAPGTTFSVSDTVQNSGTAASGSSTTRYYLSLDAVKSADDVLLTGSHAPGGLAPGASHSATVTVTIPASAPANSYFLLACADAQGTVTELDEGNNCIATPGATVTITRPDLSATVVTVNPPAPTRAPGTTLSVTDTVQNAGQVASGGSTTRYYLSLDAVKNAGDTLLTGSRGVPGLAAGASQSGTVTLTIPEATPLNSYYLLACADDPGVVVETNDANNCVATASATVTVTRPDLVESAVSAPPATKKRGTSFAMTDTVQNLGAVASGASATRHYLSLDAVKSANDILMTGSRSVPAVVAGGIQAGSITVTIPASTAPSTYYVLTCADSTNVVIETSETNNCAVSSSTMTVTP